MLSQLPREWKRTAGIAPPVAVIAGVRARLATPRWDTGDLLVGLYFAALSLLSWLYAVRAGEPPARARSVRLRRWALLLGIAVGGGAGAGRHHHERRALAHVCKQPSSAHATGHGAARRAGRPRLGGGSDVWAGPQSHNQGGSAVKESFNPAMQHQIDRMLADLCSEFAGRFDRDRIEDLMADSVGMGDEDTATVFDFVPLMAYRFTRERLNAIGRAQ